MTTDYDNLDQYMQEISAIPVIQPKEEVELAKRIEAGDDLARRKFILSNLRLVVKISHEYKGFGVPLRELISEGNVGLIEAVKRFDWSRGVKFSTYAVWWIKRAIRRRLLENGRVLSTPATVSSRIKKIKSVCTQFQHNFGREPTDHELSVKLDLSVGIVGRLKNAEPKAISLQDGAFDGDEIRLTDIIPDDKAQSPANAMESSERIELLNKLLKTLDRREYAVLFLRYGLNGDRRKTLEETGKRLNLTREGIRQIQLKALSKLRKMLADEAFPAQLSVCSQ